MAMIFCRECGNKYSDKAESCPKCGYKEAKFLSDIDKSVLIYVLLAFFLGMFGVHKFYAGKTGQGIAMLIMGTIGWLLIIPGLVAVIWAFIDFIIGLLSFKNPEKIFA